jgi:hypothetical protein
MSTVKIMPSHESQGDFVVINESDFDPKKHGLYVEGSAAQKDRTVAQLKEELTAKGIEFEATAKKADLIALLDAAS